jgi:hypothetical protein
MARRLQTVLRALDVDRARTIVLAVLGLGLAAAVAGWRDADATLQILVPLIGVALLAATWLVRGSAAGPWVAGTAGAWFAAFGLMLARSHAGECANVAGQCDLGPDPALDRAAAWLEPAIQRPVAVAFLVAGVTLVALAVRSRRRPAA